MKKPIKGPEEGRVGGSGWEAGREGEWGPWQMRLSSLFACTRANSPSVGPPQPTAAALPTLYEPDLGEAHSKGILGPQAVPRLVFFLHTVGSQGLSPAHALWRLGSCLPHSAPSMPTAGLPWGQTLPEGH